MLLTSGTVLSQVIAYILTPVITRLYTPAESAELGLFIRIITAGAAIATAKYELALPLIKLDDHSFRVYYLAFRLTLITSVCALIAIIYPMVISLNFSDAIFYLSIPFGIALLAFQNLGTNWFVRTKQFNLISYSKVVTSGVGNLLKVSLGLLQSGYVGLILGTVIGFLAGCFFYLRSFRLNKEKFGTKFRSPRNLILAKQWVDFPRINLPHMLIDTGKELLITIIIWNLFSQTVYGLYSHTFQMLRLPLVVIGSSIGQVFFQRCAEKINNGESVLKISVQSIKMLLLLSVLPFALIFFFGGHLFKVFFGLEWEMSGEYAEIMAPWLMINFVTSPISSLPLILRRQASFFKIGIFGALLMVSTLFLPASLLGANFVETLWITSIVQTVFHVIIIVIILNYARRE